MADFEAAISRHLDPDGFIARKPAAGRGEDGNPLVTTAVGLGLLRMVKNEPLSEAVKKPVMDAILSVSGWDGPGNITFAKKLDKAGFPSEDEVTKDDVVGYVAARVLLGGSVAYVAETARQDGYLSSTGKRYWSSRVWPWDQAFLDSAASRRPGLVGALLLAASFYSSIFFGQDAGNLQLQFLRSGMIRVPGRTFRERLLVKAAIFFHTRMDLPSIMATYYSDTHLFTVMARCAGRLKA
jgi:hypothetical protein